MPAVCYKKIFFILEVQRKDSDSDLDPDSLVRGTGTDPRIRIRTKMSRIPNTAPNPQKTLRLKNNLNTLTVERQNKDPD